MKPDVVPGMATSAWWDDVAVLLGYPLVVHEQNSIAGLANRVLAKVASRVVCGFPSVLSGSAWVGNPVRAEIARMPETCGALRDSRCCGRRAAEFAGAWRKPRSDGNQ